MIAKSYAKQIHAISLAMNESTGRKQPAETGKATSQRGCCVSGYNTSESLWMVNLVCFRGGKKQQKKDLRVLATGYKCEVNKCMFLGGMVGLTTCWCLFLRLKNISSVGSLLSYKEFKLSGEDRCATFRLFGRCYIWWCKMCSRRIQPGPSCTSQHNVLRKYLLRSVKRSCGGRPITAVRSERLSLCYSTVSPLAAWHM